MSNRLTFSLASLIVIFLMGIVAIPAIGDVVGMSITTTPSDSYYNAGETITVAVNFTAGDNATLSSTNDGDAWVNITIGGETKKADANISGSGSDILRFDYIVVAGDDGAVDVGANALKLKAGVTLTDGDDNSTIPITHSAPDGVDSNLHLVDAVAPKVATIGFKESGPFGVGDDIEVEVTYSEAVTVTQGNRSNVTLILTVSDDDGTATKTMNLKGSSTGVNALTLSYTVVAGDSDKDGVALEVIPASAAIYSNNVVDKAGNSVTSTGATATTYTGGIIDSTPPDFAAKDPIKITSTGPYSTGDVINVAITYNEDVVVTGAPVLDISIGGTPQIARYATSTNAKQVNFSYVVTAADVGDVTIASSAIRKPGTTSIKDSSGNDAPVNNPAVAKSDTQTVPGPDNTPPSFIAPTASDIVTDATTGVVTATLTFSEALKADSLSATGTATPTGHDTTYTVAAQQAATGNVHTVTVTPAAASTTAIPALTVTVTVRANDTAGNSLVTGDNTFNVMLAARAAVPDTTPPVLTLTKATDATTGAVTVTIASDEALKAAPTVTASGMPTGHRWSYTVGAVTAGTAANTYTVTVTPTAAADLTANVPALTVTLTVEATDTSNNTATTGNTISVMFAARTAPTLTKEEATFSGTLSLTDRVTIEVTFKNPVQGLRSTDFHLRGAVVRQVQSKAGMGNKVWQVAILPHLFVDRVSVTIASNSPRAKPAAKNGSLITAGPTRTISSITAPDTADDQDMFVAILTFAAAPSATPIANDLMVTPATATIGDIQVVLGTSGKQYGVEITPMKGSDTTIELSPAGKLRYGYAGSALTVKKKAPVITPTEPTAKTDQIHIPTATSSSGAIDLGSKFEDPWIPAYGWAVLLRDDDASKVYDATAPWIRSISTELPDLALFFGGRNGVNSGTISLHAPNHTHADDDHRHFPTNHTHDHGHDAYGDHNDDVVISEIMWGLDYGTPTHPTADPTCAQWIEFYNTTSDPINLTGWKIHFHRSLVDEGKWENPPLANPPNPTPNPANPANVNDPDEDGTLEFFLVDIASNAGVTDRFPVHQYHSPWAPKGQSGTSAPTATGANLTSMYLDINYTQVKGHPGSGVKHKVDSGADAANWHDSEYPQANLPYGIVGTPGAATVIRVKYKKTPVSQTLIINEIGNSSNDAHDWVEIHNPADPKDPDSKPVNIRNMMFTEVKNTGTDDYRNAVGIETVLFRFPDADLNIKPGRYVVFTASNPENPGNDLAAGIDITKGDLDQRRKGLGSHLGPDGMADAAADHDDGTADDNTTAFYRIHDKVKLPNGAEKRLYILRGNTDKAHIGSHPKAQENVVDVIGSLAIKLNVQTPTGWTGADEALRGRTDTSAASQRRIFDTTLWPLQWSPIDDLPDNPKTLPHGKRVDGKAEALAGSKVYKRNGKLLPDAENHLQTAGYTGIGYDRHAPANAENGGTPGYANGSLVRDKSDWMGQVTISEIMLPIEEGEGPTRVPRATRLPQWFEIFNNSLTQGVSLDQWYLEIQNTARGAEPDDFKGNLHATLRLPAVNIAPNQTVLVVAASGQNSGNFPQQRVINLFTNSGYRAELGIQNRGEPFLNTAGFYIQLRDHKNNHVDEVGNLGVSHRSSRTGVGRRDETEPTWPVPSLHDDNGHRTSFIRIYKQGVVSNGLSEDGWRRAADVNFNRVPNLTYYGNHEDRGTPGYRGGGPLPVSLSKFRPERLKETGEVVIRWITESETNNAGFNILRSETRNGEYTKLNTQLIAGQGTTSERTTYAFPDKTAKPNVVYYYQIQDVSLDGRVTPLRVNRLKGHVNAAGKATTTWGELKALQ